MKTLIRTDAVVTTQQGKVLGIIIDGVNTFRGIPYAAPPFGVNRLRPPQPAEAWTGVREALAYGAIPPQSPYPPPFDLLIPEAGDIGEDCLNLNVWSPDLEATGLPVMVYIPGGMYEAGSGGTYDGSRFARDGVVCVTINYRVGAEGFLYLGEGNANRGLLDQVAALEWVQENIAAFGGDPGNVTIFGESAGAMSVGTLLSMPRAEGLFRRAILQSGGAHQVMSAASALQVRRCLADQLGVDATREAIAEVPVARLLEVQAMFRADLISHPDPEQLGTEVGISGLPWQPTIDGDVVPGRPIDRIAAGASAGIDVMSGSNLEESNFFLVPSGTIDQIPAEALAGAIAAYGLPVETALTTYRAERPGASAGELLSGVQGDWLFRIPALRLAEAHAASPAATYLYEFAWRSPSFSGRLGACHGLDVPFVFDLLPDRTDPLLGSDPPQRLADAMHSAWVKFATSGDPGWPAYDVSRRATMRFDAEPEIVYDPQSAQRSLWEGVR
ncbi:MAG: carboxylesterase/lipase family protein [Fimbriimonadales bacterium]